MSNNPNDHNMDIDEAIDAPNNSNNHNMGINENNNSSDVIGASNNPNNPIDENIHSNETIAAIDANNNSNNPNNLNNSNEIIHAPSIIDNPNIVKAIIISQEPSISKLLHDKHSSLSPFFNKGIEKTMEFLQANGITFPCHISYNFKILKSKTAKIDYKRSINDYFKKMLGDYEFKEQLEPIIQILSDSIYQQHLKNTLWPVSRSQKTKIELNISDTHKFDSLTLFWSCIGWIVIKDETSCTQIEGNPDVKILSLDDHKLKELETKSIEEFSQKASWDNL